MKHLAVMQPTYLPWLGYFNLMDLVDSFVLLDDVEFSKRSWQQRNRIRTAEGLQWLTVPVATKGRSHQNINEAKIDDTQKFPDKHIRTIQFSYSKAPYFDRYFDEFALTLREASESGKLNRINQALIRWLKGKFGIETELKTSSELSCDGRRSELLVNISNTLDSAVYVSPPGSMNYLREEFDVFEESDVELRIQSYEHPTYPQVYDPFESHASALDLLFNVGPEALEIIRSGRTPLLTLSEAEEKLK